MQLLKQLAEPPKLGLGQECWVIRLTQTKRCLRITGIGCEFVKKPRCDHVTLREQGVTARHQSWIWRIFGRRVISFFGSNVVTFRHCRWQLLVRAFFRNDGDRQRVSPRC
jgi:hypothetical protein